MPQMPYLNCEWSRERRAISEELKKVAEEMKRRKKEELKILRQATWVTQSEAGSAEIASSHPPRNVDGEKNDAGGYARRLKKASHAPPPLLDPATESEAGSGTSSDTEGPDDTSSNSEGPNESKMSLESNRDVDKHDKLQKKLRRRKLEESLRLQNIGKLRRRLTDDINLISSYLDHSLHVSILSR
jgi:hypothetical protein